MWSRALAPNSPSSPSDSLEGQPIEDVTIDIFKAFGVGQKKKDNGAMVLLSIGDRKSRLEVGAGLGGAIPTAWQALCSMTWLPRSASNSMGPRWSSAAVRLGNAIAKDQNVQIPPPQSYRPVRRGPTGSLPWPSHYLRNLLHPDR